MAKYPAARRELVKRAMGAANALDPELGLRPSRDALDDEDRLAGVLNDLSREPARLHTLLDPVPDGAAMAERVLELRRIAGPGIDEARGTFDLYLVVRSPRAIDDAERDRLVRAHYSAKVALLEELGVPGLAGEIRAPVPIARGTRPVVLHHGIAEDHIDFLAKPYDLGSLARRIRDVLEGRRASAPARSPRPAAT